jgi:hypothetical protein
VIAAHAVDGNGAPLAIVTTDPRPRDELVMPFSRVIAVNAAECSLALVRRIRQLVKDSATTTSAAAAAAVEAEAETAAAADVDAGATPSPQDTFAQQEPASDSPDSSRKDSSRGGALRAASAGAAARAPPAAAPTVGTVELVEPDPERSEEIVTLITDIAKRAAATASAALSYTQPNRRAEWLERGIDANACDIMQTTAMNLPPRPGTAGITEIERKGKPVQWLVYVIASTLCFRSSPFFCQILLARPLSRCLSHSLSRCA